MFADVPPVVVYLWLQDIPKEETSATLQSYFTVCSTTRFFGMIMFAFAGMSGYERVTLGNCGAALVFWPGLALGCWLGLKIFHRMNPETLRKIAYTIVIVAGVMLFAKATWVAA